jgi:replication factor A1
MLAQTAAEAAKDQAANGATTPASDAAKTAFETLRKALAAKIGSDLDEADLRDEFQKYLDYGVPVDQAVKTILRHHGVAPTAGLRAGAALNQERVTLAQMPPSSASVHLRVRVLSLNTKPVTARGEQKEIVWGLLGDESGTAPYTSWRPLEGVAKGDVLDVQGAYTKEYNGQAQVNFGDRTRIAKLQPDDLPRTPTTFKDTAVAELKEGSRGIRLNVRVLAVAEKQVTVQGTPKTVWVGTVADRTGKVEFTAWADPKLAAGQAVTIEGGYVRAYRGVAQFSFDADARITPYAGDLPDAETLAIQPPVALRDLVARGGGADVTVVGTILEVRPGSGLVLRCPTPGCTRVLQAGMCRIHNKVEGTPVPDLRTKAVLDDGTAAVNVTIGRELTERLLGKTLDQAAKEAKDAFRPELAQEELRARLTGRVYRLRGNAIADDFGLSLIARSVEGHREDAKAAAAALLGAIRGGA